MQYPMVNVHTHRKIGHAELIEVYNLLTDTKEINYTGGLFSVGLHPWYVNESNLESFWNCMLLHANHEQCVAIGECGIDRLVGSDIKWQQRIFSLQLDLAKQLKLPVIIHCVRAFDLLIPYLLAYPQVKFIMHGFNKNQEIANKLLECGVFLSFGKSLLNPHHPSNAVFAQTPVNRIFLENDSNHIPMELIFEAAAKVRQCSVDELVANTYHNFKTVFLS